MPTAPPRSTRIPALEGLRGLAALVVVIHHLVLTCWLVEFGQMDSVIDHWPLPFPLIWILEQMARLLADGHLAVWIFWVMSAYVLPVRLFSSTKPFVSLLIRRYVRLLVPVLGSVLLAWAILKAGGMFAHTLAIQSGPPYSTDWLASFYNFPPNLPFALRTAFWDTFFHFDEPSSYNPVLWTIEKEFWGSVLIYALAGLLRADKNRLAIYLLVLVVFLLLKKFWIVAFVAGLIASDYDHHPEPLDVWKWLRVQEQTILKFQAIGVVISLIGLLCLRPALELLHFPTDLKNLLLSLVIVYATLRIKVWGHFFSQKWLLWLGKISFSLYLVHLPLLCSFTSGWVIIHGSFWEKILGSLLSLALVIGVGAAFERWVDRPGVRLSKRLFSTENRTRFTAEKRDEYENSDQPGK